MKSRPGMRAIVMWLCVLVASSALAEAKEPAKSSAQLKATAQAHVRAQLKDPEAARFRNVRVTKDGALVCGEVNAKNSFGAYVGYRRFYFLPGDMRVSVPPRLNIEGSEDELQRDTFPGLWAEWCASSEPPSP